LNFKTRRASMDEKVRDRLTQWFIGWINIDNLKEKVFSEKGAELCSDELLEYLTNNNLAIVPIDQEGDLIKELEGVRDKISDMLLSPNEVLAQLDAIIEKRKGK